MAFQSEDFARVPVASLAVGLLGGSLLGLTLDILIDVEISPFILDFLIYCNTFVLLYLKYSLYGPVSVFAVCCSVPC